jgi:hypothetical protein
VGGLWVVGWLVGLWLAGWLGVFVSTAAAPPRYPCKALEDDTDSKREQTVEMDPVHETVVRKAIDDEGLKVGGP